MTGTSWIIDSQRIASKIKNVSGSRDLSKQKWMSNPTKECPKCSHVIDNSDVVHQWPGLPKGVKFDPSDQELLWHLLAKHDKAGSEPHPFIDEFIPTVEEDDGICYTHPQKLPGVKQDGSVSHFFHRTFKAYNTGTRKRRKINTGDLADVRWHKTGKTKPVILNGEHLGCKKIMVLYMSTVKGGKPKKTNWVMHQYHLGTGEDEKNGEYVVSKLFFQQQFKPGEKSALELPNTDALETIVSEAELPDLLEPTMEEEDERISGISFLNNEYNAEEEALHSHEHNTYQENGSCEINMEEKAAEENAVYPSSEKPEDGDNPPSQDPNLWEGDSQFSQFLLDSQQLAENLACCDEFLQSQPSSGDGDEPGLIKPRLAVYAQLPVEDLKKDLQECKDLGSSDDATLEPGNKDLQECKDLGPSDDATLEPENTAEFRLSQIQFSQDSYTAWAGDKAID